MTDNTPSVKKPKKNDPRIQEIERLEKAETLSAQDKVLIAGIIDDLDAGILRVATKEADMQGASAWTTHAWIKKAILLYFKTQTNGLINIGDINFFDKVPIKKWTGSEGVRAVPMALARKGSFVEKGAILMPSYVNIGAFVGGGSMVDTWATVGSCAQIGKNVHLSGGVGIGGVLEPAQSAPVIIEDDAFLGSRCVVVEGVHVGQAAVLGAGVVLTASTRVIDVTGNEEKITKGAIPPRAVVIPGTTQKTFPAGSYGVPCALIIGYRTEATDKKTSLNQALRDFQVSV